MTNPEEGTAAQRYVAEALKRTTDIPDVPSDTPTFEIDAVGVIGAGTMGGGIAMNFLNIGVPVTLVDRTQEALDRGIGVIRKNYERSAKRGRITVEQVEERMALINPAIEMTALSGVDLVIEAVFEDMDLKKDIFRQLDGICKDGAVLASNTSFLDLDQIAAATSRPEAVVGMHFFSPANVMKLVEVVRGEKTSKEVIATAMAIGERIGKVPILARVCDGFVANRVMVPRDLESRELTLEGPTPKEIDDALAGYGFAMGPFAMIDLVGLDVILPGPGERTLTGDLVERGMLGQKNGHGFYDYDENRNATPSPVAAEVIAQMAKDRGVAQTGSIPDEKIVARLLYPVVNEGAKILEEGVAIRASDIDVACILGYNWPAETGGPMFWADSVGLDKIIAGLKEMGTRPTALLVDLADKGKRLSDCVSAT